MSLWIKRDTHLARNRKTYVLADLLAQGAGDLFAARDPVAWRAIAMALLEEFWSHLVEHHPDGDLTDVHADALRDPVQLWLEGTEWRHRDVRDLLLKSGHLERTAGGRIVPRDWLEWTGSDALRLANDRKRKRLQRATTRRTRPAQRKSKRRTRPRTEAGRVHGQTALEEKRREEKREVLLPQQQPPPAASRTLDPAPLRDYATRAVVAVNRVLDQRLAGGFKPLVATVEHHTAAAWQAAGIPIAFLEDELVRLTERFAPRGNGNRQPHSLAYFDGAIREAWAGAEARAAGPVLTDAEKAHALLLEEQAKAKP